MEVDDRRRCRGFSDLTLWMGDRGAVGVTLFDGPEELRADGVDGDDGAGDGGAVGQT